MRAQKLQPVDRPEALRDQVYARLRAMLREGDVVPGRRLYENVLAGELGVSRTPVREALALLANEGLLTPEGRGYSAPSLSQGDVADIYELRRLLEPAAIARATSHAAPAALAEMRDALDRSRAAHGGGDVSGFVIANGDFRDAWLAMVPSRRMVRAVRLYDDHVVHLRSLTLADAEVRGIVLNGLEAILGRVQAGDAPCAAEAMRAHLTNAERCLRRAAGLDANVAGERA